MAKTDEKVMRMVEQELTKNPEASVDDLFEKAKAMSSGIGRMNRRQFHARYPLQVKRKRGGGARRGRKAGKKAGRKAAAAGAGAAVKGTRGPGRPRGRGRRRAAAAAGGGGDNREAVRQVFLRFAQDVAAADTPAALVKLILNVDKYVDEAVR